MSVLKYFKNTPGRPMGGRQGSCRPSHGRQDPNVIFFWNLQRGPWPGGGGLSPPQRATGACRPPQGRQGPSPLYKTWPSFPCHLSLKIQEKERGEKKKSGEALPNSALVIYR